MPKTPDEIEAMLGGWKYIDELEAESEKLKARIKRLESDYLAYAGYHTFEKKYGRYKP